MDFFYVCLTGGSAARTQWFQKGGDGDEPAMVVAERELEQADGIVGAWVEYRPRLRSRLKAHSRRAGYTIPPGLGPGLAL